MRRRRIHGHLRRRSSCKPSPLKSPHTFKDAQANAMRAQAKKDEKKTPDDYFVSDTHIKNENPNRRGPGGKDSLLENVAEYFDPTGVSSWDDAARAYKKDEWGVDDYLDMASAIPFFGKAAKYLKGGKAVINLAKTGSAALGARRLVDATDTAKYIYEDNL